MFEGEETPLLLRRRVIGALVVLFVALVAAWFITAEFFGLRYEIEAEPFQSWVQAQGPLGPLVYIGVLAISVLVAPIPNMPIFIAAGLAWGPVLGTVYSLAGMTLGSVAAFWVARWLGRRHLPRLIGSRAAARIDTAAEQMGGKVIFWARMLPVINFDWVSYVAGLTAMRFRTYLVWSVAGMVLPTAVAVTAGDGLAHDIRLTLSAAGVWLLGVVLTAAYFWWRRRQWLAQKASRPGETVTSLTDVPKPDGEDTGNTGQTLIAKKRR